MPAAILLGYLLGSIPFALVIARLWGGGDPRGAGSGNPGAANVARTSGLAAGVVVALLDISKGVFSVWLARRLSDQSTAPAIAGLAAVVGHMYPVWLRFEGGKGVATAAGVFAALSPAIMAPALIVFIVVVATTRYVSVASVAASLSVPPAALLVGTAHETMAIVAMVTALILFRHRANLVRLRAGVEPRFGVRPSLRTAVPPAFHGTGDT